MSVNRSIPVSASIVEFWLSIAAAALLAVTSLAGVIFTSRVYPTGDLVTALLPNDIVNLILGLPCLLVAMFLARRGRAWVRLCWPGALLYVVYNSLIAVVSLRPGWLHSLHLAQIALCLAAVVIISFRLEDAAMNRISPGRIEKAAGGILAAFAVLFFRRGAALTITAADPSFFGAVEFSVTLADMFFSIFWFYAGVSLLRGRAAGYIGTAAGLSQLSLLFAGLMLVMVVQPMISRTPMKIADFLVIVVMSLVAIIPTVLYIASLDKKLEMAIKQ